MILVLDSFRFRAQAKKEEIWSKSDSNGVNKQLFSHPHGLDMSQIDVYSEYSKTAEKKRRLGTTQPPHTFCVSKGGPFRGHVATKKHDSRLGSSSLQHSACNPCLARFSHI